MTESADRGQRMTANFTFAPAGGAGRLCAIRVLVAVAVRLYREGIAHILAQRDGLEVVETAAGGGELIERTTALKPDVVLLDTALGDGLQTVRRLLQAAPSVRIVALGLGDDDPEIISYAEAGMSGYISRSGSAEELVESIRAVTEGDFICSPHVAAMLLRKVARSAPIEPQLPADLTRRERQVMELMLHDLTNKEIASRLHIEVSTVKIHVHHILEKLHVSHRRQAAHRVQLLGRQ